MRLAALALGLPAALLVAACQDEKAEPRDAATKEFVEEQAEEAATVPGDTGDTAPYDGIAEDEVLHFTGTEPFWGGEVSGMALRYTTPENQDGVEIAVERFAGRGGIAYSGMLEGADLEMTITPLECSDGMSDRTYPFTVVLAIGEDKRNGCAWSEQHPFAGPEHP